METISYEHKIKQHITEVKLAMTTKNKYLIIYTNDINESKLNKLKERWWQLMWRKDKGHIMKTGYKEKTNL